MRATRGMLVGSLALIVLGIVLLLQNFLLLADFNVGAFAPLILVILGAIILLRGDLLSGGEARTFGITRGSVERATLEISAGEIDVSAQPLQREGRLIAGQYAVNSRPALDVQDNHATLLMNRAATPWLSFADWSMNLAHDLPWTLLVSTHLGQANFDLTGLIVQRAVIATGFGDIRLIAPAEAFEPLILKSTLGNIQVLVPTGVNARVTVSGARFFKIHVDDNRYTRDDAAGAYLAREGDGPLVDIYVSGTFGDAYLA
ncbi:MAG: hypothetical protein IPO91_32350 [Chloroflexi bacterium]|nr:hypothetical protein [Chloroflexota bacterium]